MRGESQIYNSRNYSILLNNITVVLDILSTTVEIILYYLTCSSMLQYYKSTTVEIILYYLTSAQCFSVPESTTVEIILYYLTICASHLSSHNLQQ